MMRRRATYVLTMDLDAIPGTNHDPREMAEYLDAEFKRRMPHYRPEIQYVPMKIETVAGPREQSLQEFATGDYEPDPRD